MKPCVDLYAKHEPIDLLSLTSRLTEMRPVGKNRRPHLFDGIGQHRADGQPCRPLCPNCPEKIQLAKVD